MAGRVKICGITRPDDAVFAVEAGAAAIGVILAWGPRLIDQDRVREISAAVSGTGVPVIGVVGEVDGDELLRIADRTGLSGFQFHRGGDDTSVEKVRSAGLLAWRVAHLLDVASAVERIAAVSGGADVVLIEPQVPGGSGGRGIAVSHEVARVARRSIAPPRMGLAGGLTPDNVAGVARVVDPDWLDVSSGVEGLVPGVKDRALVLRFMEGVG